MAAFPILYLAVLIAVGLAYRRQAAAGEESFFLARRSAGLLLLTGSLLATMFGSFGVLGVSGLAAANGLVAGWYHWVGTIGLVVLALWAWRRLDPAGAYTLPEIFGRAYGKPVRVFAACLIVVAWMGIIAAQLIAAGKVLMFLGSAAGWWEGSSVAILRTLLVVVTVVFATYTALGGQHSVLRTDGVQILVIMLALVLLVGGTMIAFPDAGTSIAAAQWDFPFSAAMPATAWLGVLLAFGVPFLVGPDFYSRLLSGRDADTGRRAILAAAAIMVPLVLLIVLGGMLGSAVLGDRLVDRELVLLALGAEILHPVLLGLMVAALLAAVMSSADTCLMTVATLLSRDVFDVLGWRPPTETAIVVRSRVIIAGAAIVACVVAIGLRDIVSALMMGYRLYSPAVLVPFLALLVWRGRVFPIGVGLAAVGLGAGSAAVGLAVDHPLPQYLAYVLPAIPLMVWRLRPTNSP